MKIEMIELSKLNELLQEYQSMGNRGETFSDFIRVSKCIFDDEKPLFDWVYVEKENIIEVREDD